MFDFLAITCIANKDAWRCDRTIQISCVFFVVASVLLFISFYVLFADTLEEIQNVTLGKGERAKVVQN